MSQVVNFTVKDQLKKRLDKVRKKSGLSLSEIARRGLLEQIRKLEEDSND